MNLLAYIRSFCKPCSKKFGLSTWSLYRFIDKNILWVRHCKFQQPSCYDFSVMTFSNCTHTGKILVEIFPIGVSVQWIHPRSISDSNIREKNLIWLAWLRKNIKPCQIKGSLNRSCQQNNTVFRSWRSC